MSTQTGTQTKTYTPHTEGEGWGQVVPFEQIHEPGTYICNWNGFLVRVPQDSIAPGRSPLISLLGPTPLFVTKISSNPYLPITKARLLAANLDVAVCF